ncbi:MAG: putative beta-lysine N-acetyltransferase [Deltaproteobacteria bacterium]|nr:putative beta-lysine N-acetyltransferase [Deltaproteobacteria bacterium]MBW2661341.1 putative beta-lysine N-acetyltransferase [Deltaproteobacteria bacterium]
MDIVETFKGSLIQHGLLNRRIYLMKLGDADPDQLIPALKELAEKRKYTKIFAKVPSSKAGYFFDAGYQKEAVVPNFHNGCEDVSFLGCFISPKRKESAQTDKLDNILNMAKSKGAENVENKPISSEAEIRQCNLNDVYAMSNIYKVVFPTYPFPIDSPEYLLETMHTHVVYFGVEIEGKLVALSSAEMDESSQNVEMTDFATCSAWRGNGFAYHLLKCMEEEMKTRGIKTAYTIARAISYGMNITFAKMGYAFGGRLVNNTNISGQIESMNVWHKSLRPL